MALFPVFYYKQIGLSAESLRNKKYRGEFPRKQRNSKASRPYGQGFCRAFLPQKYYERCKAGDKQCQNNHGNCKLLVCEGAMFCYGQKSCGSEISFYHAHYEKRCGFLRQVQEAFGQRRAYAAQVIQKSCIA